MPTDSGRRPCRFCRRWFQVDPRLKDRQYACSSLACQARRQKTDVAAWLDRHPGYLQRYRETHPAYVDNNRQAQRLRDRRKKLHLDIQNKIKKQPPEIINQLWDSSHLDIQNVSELQPLEMTFLFSTFPCLDIQNSLDNKGCPKENGVIEARM